MQARSVLVAFFIVCTAIVTLFVFPQSTAAQTEPIWARWFIEVEFEDSKMLAQMTVEIGHEDRSGNPVIDESIVNNIHCQEYGSVPIFGDVAEFDGSSYFHCTIPSFQDQVYELTGGKITLEDSCTCKVADTLVDFSFSSTSDNALFYMPELQFSAPYQAGPYFDKANYQLYVNGELAVSEEFTPSKYVSQGSGAFIETAGVYTPKFLYGTLNLGSTPETITTQLEIPTNETEFLIGLNPKTGAGLAGNLRYLYVDPGCIGHGGI